MTTPYLVADIGRDEALAKLRPDGLVESYPDPLSPLAKALRAGKPTAGLSGAPWTIGYGETGAGIGPGLVWTQAQCEDARAASIAKAKARLDAGLPWWRQLDDARQDVMVNLAFNLGEAELATWKHTLADIQAGRFKAAEIDLENDQPWASQVRARAQRLALQMETGVRQQP